MDHTDVRPRLMNPAGRVRGRNGAAHESTHSHCAESDAPLTVAMDMYPSRLLAVGTKVVAIVVKKVIDTGAQPRNKP